MEGVAFEGGAFGGQVRDGGVAAEAEGEGGAALGLEVEGVGVGVAGLAEYFELGGGGRRGGVAREEPEVRPGAGGG